MYREHLVMVFWEAGNATGEENDRIRSTTEKELEFIDRDSEAKGDERKGQVEFPILDRTEWFEISNKVPTFCCDRDSIASEEKRIQIETISNSWIRSGALGSTVINRGTDPGALNSTANNRVAPEVAQNQDRHCRQKHEAVGMRAKFLRERPIRIFSRTRSSGINITK